MTELSEIRTWVSTKPKLPPAPQKPFKRPAATFAETAKRESRAARASWDRNGANNVYKPEAVLANRQAWVAMLPHGPFDRADATASWGVGRDTAGKRVHILAKAGMLRVLPGEPLRWERCE